VAVVDLMEAEHASIDRLLSSVDTSLTAEDETALDASVQTLTASLTADVEHEENQALPLVATLLGPKGLAELTRTTGKTEGLREAPSSSPGCSTTPRPRPTNQCSACSLRPYGSSTGPGGGGVTPAPRGGIPRRPEL